MPMADEENARALVKPPSTGEIERIAREQARETLASAFRRMGIDPEHPEQWHSFFAEVKSTDARTAVQLTISRQKIRDEFLATVRSEGVKKAMQGLSMTLIAGVLYYITTGAKR